MLASTLTLRQIHLFSECDEATLLRISAQCQWRDVAAKTPVFTRHSSGHEVYFLLSGQVRITTYSAQGREVAFRDYLPGEHFGDLSAIDGQQRSADVLAMQDSQLVSMSSTQFRQLLAQEPQLAMRMLRHLTAMVRQLTERVLELSNWGVATRLHVELLRLASHIAPDGSASIEPAPTQAALASKISATREQVAREFSALIKSGVLRKSGTRALHIRQVHDLQQLVDAATQSPV